MIEIDSRNEFRTFVRKVSLFLIPLFALIAFPLCLFWYHGEFKDEKEAAAEQFKYKNFLFGKAYITSGLHEAFKTESLRIRMPEVLVLGDSRVLQFRSKFFSDASFYNAGGLVGRLEELKSILDSIPVEKSPKIIIVGFDHPFFHPDWEKNHYQKQNKVSVVWQITFALKRFYISLFRGEYTVEELFVKTNTNIGLVASVRGDGVASDGSYVYGSYYRDPYNPENPDFAFRDTFERIEQGERLFESSSEISSTALPAVASFLDEAKKRNIHVVGFLPPYPHVVYERIQSDPKLLYMQKINPKMQTLFNTYEYPFYDFSDLATVGADDKETIDGFHASEKAHLRLFIEMAKSDSVLAQHADIPYLERRLQEAGGDYEVFKSEF